MSRKRYSVEQIVAAVKQHEQGTPATEICRRLGIAEATLYRWRQQLPGAADGQGIKQNTK